MAGEAIVIRPVRSEEQAALGELTVRVYRQVLGRQLGDYAEVLRDVAGRLAASCEVLVAVRGSDGNGGVQGGVTYVPGANAYASLAGVDEAEIRMLVVAPLAQRVGIGEALVRACVERAAAQGRRALVLHTTDAMVAAQRLYERLGFRPDPGRNTTVGAELCLRCYSLELAGSG